MTTHAFNGAVSVSDDPEIAGEVDTPRGTDSLVAMLPATADLDALMDPGARILVMCERAKTWLAQALEGDQIEQLVEMKCQAEAIRVYTMQRELGKDAELAAQELVRRAERCIGLAIRKGQAEGAIRGRGQRKHGVTHDLPSPTDFASQEELIGNQAGIYDLTDSVTDEHFEAALDVAKAEKNLSRANVVRKTKAAAAGELSESVNRWEKLGELAQSGYTSHQIAEELGVTPQVVRTRCRELGITIRADVVLGKTRKTVDHNRILSGIVDTLEALYPSCKPAQLSSVDRELLARAIKVMDRAMPAFARLRKRIRKELDNG